MSRLTMEGESKYLFHDLVNVYVKHLFTLYSSYNLQSSADMGPRRALSCLKDNREIHIRTCTSAQSLSHIHLGQFQKEVQPRSLSLCPRESARRGLRPE